MCETQFSNVWHSALKNDLFFFTNFDIFTQNLLKIGIFVEKPHPLHVFLTTRIFFFTNFQHVSSIHVWRYQGQGHLPRSRSNTKVTVFKKAVFGGLVFYKHSLYENISIPVPSNQMLVLMAAKFFRWRRIENAFHHLTGCNNNTVIIFDCKWERIYRVSVFLTHYKSVIYLCL